MKKKVFLLKYFLPAVLLFIAFIIWAYVTSGIFVPLGIQDFFLFLFFLFGVAVFWGILEIAQNVTGDLMNGSWSQRIIFIIAAIIMIYLYKSTGRI